MKVGLQLYTVREAMQNDVEGTLAKVKAMGYDYVEFAGYFDHSADEIRGMLDRTGLECISVHQVYDVFLKDEKASIDYLKTIGAKYCAVPWMGKEKHKGTDLFDKTVGELTQIGKALADSGITLLYHNHEFEFELFDGKCLLDWLYETISPDLLQTEIDTCWVGYAGYSPVEYIQKYKGRCPIVHLKDYVCTNAKAGSAYALIGSDGKELQSNSREENGFTLKPLGQGVQEFAGILEACKTSGTEYVIVEQDNSADVPLLECAQISRNYLKELGI